MVSVDINIKKQKYPIETKEIRDRTKLTGPTLAQNFTPPDFSENTTIDEAASQLNTELHKALDTTASIKSINSPTDQNIHGLTNLSENRRV